jgi:hypothetical protein
MTRTGKPDLIRMLGAVAGVSPAAFSGFTDPLAAGRHLAGGASLTVTLPHPVLAAPDGIDDVSPPLPDDLPPPPGAEHLLGIEGVSMAADPDEADIALVLHLPGADAQVTAYTVQAMFSAGHRVALVDVSAAGEERADPALLPALAGTTVYISNLAAFDVDVRRALAAVFTPIRDGAAHRRYLAHTILYYWAWRGIVEHEVRGVFDAGIPDRWMLRATTQARSRLGAVMLKLRGRGLRYFVGEVGFDGGRVDGMWVTLTEG